jgi:hypothetical protein
MSSLSGDKRMVDIPDYSGVANNTRIPQTFG